VKKRVRIYALVIAALVGAALTIGYFSTELSAIAWHVRHGFYTEFGGIRVRVPLAYEASDSRGLPRLSMLRMAGHLWHGGGAISIDFHKQPSPEAVRLLESRGVLKKTKIGEQTATFAGRPGNCTESIPLTGDARLQELIQERNFREIDCWFGGNVEVMLSGTANLKDDFYSIIQTAAPAQGSAK
jgi:hypothetical protein